jgi:hypothetical protein
LRSKLFFKLRLWHDFVHLRNVFFLNSDKNGRLLLHLIIKFIREKDSFDVIEFTHEGTSHETATIMNSYLSLKSLLTFSNNVIQATVPKSACSRCIVSFISQANEAVVTKDIQKMEMVRAIDSLWFMFNSSLSEGRSHERTAPRIWWLKVWKPWGRNITTFGSTASKPTTPG